jgi:hypothetical protein
MTFEELWERLLQAHMLRVANIKDICVDLSNTGKIEETWSGRARKPQDRDKIRLALD